MEHYLANKLLQSQLGSLSDTDCVTVDRILVAVMDKFDHQVGSMGGARSFLQMSLPVADLPVNEHVQARIIECVRLRLYLDNGVYAKSEQIAPAPASGIPVWTFRASLFPQDLM